MKLFIPFLLNIMSQLALLIKTCIKSVEKYLLDKFPWKAAGHPIENKNRGSSFNEYLIEFATLEMIGDDMVNSGISAKFVTEASKVALEFDGVFDLMQLWYEERDNEEREKILVDLKECVHACNAKIFAEKS